MKKVKLSRVKGTRDFIFSEYRKRQWLFETISRVYEEYGFAPMETPAMEQMSILTAKSGEDIAGEIFRIQDSEWGLRFDLTVPFARVVLSNSYPLPFKRYHIGRVWRREEAQRGRYREFWQADADIFGSESLLAEAEILSAANSVIKEVGLKAKIHLNSRKLMNEIVSELGLSEQTTEILRVLDKSDKLPKKEIEDMLTGKIGEEKSRELLQIISDRKRIEEFEAYSEIEELKDYYPDFVFDPGIIRGLGYYDGIVFEVRKQGERLSLGGGGRYGALFKAFGYDGTAVGIGLGVERILLEIGDTKDFEDKATKVFVVGINIEFQEIKKIVDYLRSNHIPTEFDMNNRKVRKQLEYVSAYGIPYVIFVGKKEVESGRYTLRNMETGKEEILTKEDLLERLSN